MTEVNDRNSANVCIYCDDERRWKARVDPITKRNTGGWEDPDNWIQYTGKSEWSNPGCHDTQGGMRFTYAQTYKTYMAGSPPEQQAEIRATVTMCELGLFNVFGNKKPRRVLSQLDENLDLTKANEGVEAFKLHSSKTLLHELSHFYGYDTDDKATFFKSPRGLSILQISVEDLNKNADMRAYLGQLAILADRGYIFQRAPLQSATQKEQGEFNANMENDRLFAYPNLAKRDLRRVARVARRYTKA